MLLGLQTHPGSLPVSLLFPPALPEIMTLDGQKTNGQREANRQYGLCLHEGFS